MWFSLTFPWLFQSHQNSLTFPWLENAFPFFQVFQVFQSEWEPWLYKMPHCSLCWKHKKMMWDKLHVVNQFRLTQIFKCYVFKQHFWMEMNTQTDMKPGLIGAWHDTKPHSDRSPSQVQTKRMKKTCKTFFFNFHIGSHGLNLLSGSSEQLFSDVAGNPILK